MTENDPDLFALEAMPELAAALRQAREVILRKWEAAVEAQLPDADPLTSRAVRDSIPKVLDQFIAVLESADAATTAEYYHRSRFHGSSRFHQSFNMRELIVEYRLLRRIVMEEIDARVAGGLKLKHAIALGMGVDVALQQAVLEFVVHLSAQLHAETEARSKYLAFLSHDMRNNLNAVVLSMELLSRRLGGAPEFADAVVETRQLIRQVSQTVEGMDRLLQSEQLRKVARQPSSEPVDIAALLRDVAQRHRSKAEEKAIRIEVAAPEGAAARTDQELARLVLQNLVGNAVKYSSKGVIRLEASHEREGWVISVADQGPGIAADKLGEIFQAFSRGETHGQEGMGLGLSIASEAAKAIGARLSVESTLGRGSTFRVHLGDGGRQ